MERKKPKPKKCQNSECDKFFVPVYSSTQQVCSIKCAAAFNSEKEIKKRHDQLKIETVKLSDLEKVARAIFQKFIRERDKDLPCISCGTNTTQQWDGGHFYKAELYSGLIFDEDNVHKQCCYCNGPYMDGNLILYRQGLIKRHGFEIVKRLESIADQKREYKFSRGELIDIANTYKKKLKDLQTLNKTTDGKKDNKQPD